MFFFFFFFNDTATTEIYTLSLHDALPISSRISSRCTSSRSPSKPPTRTIGSPSCGPIRSEEHTSELQSQSNLVCRLLLEKKKKNTTQNSPQAASTALNVPTHSRCNTYLPV